MHRTRLAAAACFAVCILHRFEAAAAIPYVYPFNAMSGQEVIDQRLKEPKSQLDYIRREKVEAYLNGIKDAAHGSAWCLNQPVLPEELNLAVVRRLKASRKPGELKGNAAPLVLAELRQRFPCAKPKPDKKKSETRKQKR